MVLGAIAIAIGSAGVTAFVVQNASSISGARLFQQVLHLTSTQYVDALEADSIYAQAARGLLKEIGDPYSALLSPKQMQQFARQMGGEYAGIGTALNRVNNDVVIMKVFPNTPAARAGVIEGDRIVGIDSVDVAGWHEEKISETLRGEAGTSVRLRLGRDGFEEPVEVFITRQIVHIPAVPYSTVLEGGIGYVPLQQFGSSAAKEVGEAIAGVSRGGATKIVLDLRGNGGGLTDQAVKISSYFLPLGQSVVTMKDRNGGSRTEVTMDEPIYPDVPLIVLVDGASASASEIVAGALQDHDRAVVLGSGTFGKGSAQSIFKLEEGYALKLTTQRWYTPLGRSIQKDQGSAAQGVASSAASAAPAPATESEEDMAARPRYTTDAGRTIIGGGGIMPDRIVTGEALSSAERKLIDIITPKVGVFHTEINALALKYRSRVQPDFKVTPEMRKELLSGLAAKGLTIDKETVARSGEYLDRIIGARISTLTFGDSLTKHRFLSQDLQLLTAVSMLKVADSQNALFAAVADHKKLSAPVSTTNPISRAQ